MTDIVERLRQPHDIYTEGVYCQACPSEIAQEAADEIERLRADATRWTFVRDHLLNRVRMPDNAQIVEFKHCPVIWDGEKIDVVIDRMMGEFDYRPAQSP